MELVYSMTVKISSERRKKFDEERARQILAFFFPDKYSDSYLSERPDIVNKKLDIGVEVTNSQKPSIHEGLSRSNSITGKREVELSWIDKENIRENNIFVDVLPEGQFLAGIMIWGSADDIMNIFDKKTKRLNNADFQIFNINNLFIFAWMIDKEEISEFISTLKLRLNASTQLQERKQNKVESLKFDFVYVFNEHTLQEICLSDITVNEYFMDEQAMTEISENSFEKIIGKKRKEFYNR